MFDLLVYIKDLIARKFTGKVVLFFKNGGVSIAEETIRRK